MKRMGLFTVLCISVCMLMGGCGSNSSPDTEESTITMEENTTEETTQTADKPEGQRGNGGENRGGAGMMPETDPELLAVVEENAEKFQQFSYTDETLGITLEYSLYIPESYDENTSYPLLMYIPDSTGAGKSAAEIVGEYYGADIWVTEEEQDKHASFVLVPAFTETVVDDDWSTSDQIEVVVRLIENLSEQYNVDENRIYATGQSMGCMTSLYLNSEYPDLFAASLFVSGQWDISVLQELENEKFFYITAGGDMNASGGQDEVKAMFDADGIPYSYGTWNAQNSAEEQDAAVEALISEENQANMLRFEAGTVFKEGESGMEHMASFNYAYKITAVRDWLYEQTK